jgi:hypothetical protein
VSKGFDFTHYIRILCEDITSRLKPLEHVDMSRVAVSFSQARSASRRGMYATLTPLRFADGRLHTIRRGRKWGMQKVKSPDGQEMLYILNFYLPRFLDLSLRQKLDTVFHELWHIGPKFNGDLRRFGTRFFAHGRSKKTFDCHVADLVDQWLEQSPPDAVYGFLNSNFSEIQNQYGPIYGTKIPMPKLYRVD